jgi:hypothetical protein
MAAAASTDHEDSHSRGTSSGRGESEAASPDTATTARPDAVPAALLTLYLSGFTLVLAAYFFVIFCVTRGLLSGIGFSFATLFQCFVVTLVMAGFIVWLAPTAHILEVWYLHRLPAQRAKRGQCPGCGYAMRSEATDAARCPECGGDLSLPRPFEFGWQGIRRFLLLGSTAYVIGSAVAIVWISTDESAFMREALANRTHHHERPRAWPTGFSTLIYDGERATSSSIAEPEIEPRWRPRPQ